MKNKNSNNNALYASIGSALEYFDFAAFGLLYIYISDIFFEPSNGFSSDLKSLLVYSVGFLARPFGGLVAGIIGDFYGRRLVFLTLTSIMSISTLFIGMLLPYKSIGAWASLLLIFFRIMQGLSFGGEIAGASTIIEESSRKEKKIINFSMMISGTSLGALCANGLVSYLSNTLSSEDMVSFGWRIPFILGGFLGIILWFLRRNVTETLNLNKEERYAKESTLFIFLKSLRTYKSNLLLAAGVCSFTSALLTTNIFFPFLLKNYFNHNTQIVYLYTTYSLVGSIFMCPIIGLCIKKISQYKYLEIIQLLYVATVFPLFIGLNDCSQIYLLLFLCLQQFFIVSMFISQGAIISSVFPSSIRYTSVAITTNIISAIASMLPMFYSNFCQIYNFNYLIPSTLNIICIISLLSAKILHKRIEL